MVTRPYFVARLSEDENDLYDVTNFAHRLVTFIDCGTEFVLTTLCE